MARRTLQRQLTVFARTMLIGFCALFVIEQLFYLRYPQQDPRAARVIVLLGAVCLTPFATAWYVLARRELTRRALHAIDLGLMAATGAVLAANVWLSLGTITIGYGYVLCALIAASARVLVVPSSRVRTAVASVLALAPLVFASVVLAAVQLP